MYQFGHHQGVGSVKFWQHPLLKCFFEPGAFHDQPLIEYSIPVDGMTVMFGSVQSKHYSIKSIHTKYSHPFDMADLVRVFYKFLVKHSMFSANFNVLLADLAETKVDESIYIALRKEWEKTTTLASLGDISNQTLYHRRTAMCAILAWINYFSAGPPGLTEAQDITGKVQTWCNDHNIVIDGWHALYFYTMWLFFNNFNKDIDGLFALLMDAAVQKGSDLAAYHFYPAVNKNAFLLNPVVEFNPAPTWGNFGGYGGGYKPKKKKALPEEDLPIEEEDIDARAAAIRAEWRNGGSYLSTVLKFWVPTGDSPHDLEERFRANFDEIGYDIQFDHYENVGGITLTADKKYITFYYRFLFRNRMGSNAYSKNVTRACHRTKETLIRRMNRLFLDQYLKGSYTILVDVAPLLG